MGKLKVGIIGVGGITSTPSPVPAEQSLQVIQILDGIYRSQEAEKEVRI
ncbi:MAG: hypothetical protein HYW07_01090 [Candidatus Latescibacteria bacterium]|nr:hypothetical protein [Candidatus Latescibacterota bacterium]